MKTTISKVAFFVSALVLSTAGIGDEVCSNAVMLAREDEGSELIDTVKLIQ